MLKGISPLLGPDLLHALRSMGHTQEIALIDANCPIPPGHHRVLRADGVSLADLLDAVLSVLPVDDFVDKAIFRFAVNGDPSIMIPVFEDAGAVVERHLPGSKIHPLSGDEFSKRLAGAHTIVMTGERRLYGNVILRKGVVHPE